MTDTGTRPSGIGLFKHYAILTYGAFGTMADIGLSVFGALSIGISIAVLLGGFGLVDVTGDSLSTGEMLVSGIVLGVTGMFCLGVASEGPLGRGRRLVGFKTWEVGVGRALAAAGVGLLGILAYNLLSPLVTDVPSPIVKGLEGLRATGRAGLLIVPFVGVPISLGFRFVPDSLRWLAKMEIPSLFVVWVIAAFAMLT